MINRSFHIIFYHEYDNPNINLIVIDIDLIATGVSAI